MGLLEHDDTKCQLMGLVLQDDTKSDTNMIIKLLVSNSALASWHHEASNCAWSPYQELSYCAVSPTYLTPHQSPNIQNISFNQTEFLQPNIGYSWKSKYQEYSVVISTIS